MIVVGEERAVVPVREGRALLVGEPVGERQELELEEEGYETVDGRRDAEAEVEAPAAEALTAGGAAVEERPPKPRGQCCKTRLP